MQNCSLAGLLTSSDRPDPAVILTETNLRIPYGSLRDQVLNLAEQLGALGIRKGDRIATAFPNGLPAIVSFLAASLVGTAAPLNPGYREEEIKFYLQDAGAKVLLLPPDGAAEAHNAARHHNIVTHVLEMDSTGVVRMRGVPRQKTPVDPRHDDVALVLHTSGSTGKPKRVPILHRNIAASLQNIVSHYALTPADVYLCFMPLFHVHGLVSVLSTLASGGTVVIPPKFNPLAFGRIVRETRPTWYSAVPAMHKMLLSRMTGARPEGTPGLRFIRSCSAALTPALMTTLEQNFGAPVLEAYGMTEASHQIASNPLPPRARVAGSVGITTGVKAAAMNESGELLSTGAQGEIVIQGPNVIAGYENNPQADAASFVNGWFRTGDLGYIDSSGYLTITGRLKELINRGGEKISPREVDEVLLQHPCVSEAVAFGVAHPTWGEEVAAAVVLHQPANESALIAFCKERLADFKCPKKIYIVESIPRTATQKVQRMTVAAALTGK